MGGKLWTVNGALHGVVHGVLANKSNSRQAVPMHGRYIWIKEKAAHSFEKSFMEAVSTSCGLKWTQPSGYLGLEVVAWYADWRRDLDCELIPDMLQKAKLIDNDRYITIKLYRRRTNKDFPHVEFKLYPADRYNPMDDDEV